VNRLKIWNDVFPFNIFRLGELENGRRTKGLLIVLSAPSGTGKTSVLFEVLKRHPEMKFSVSVTTRTPREGEKDGINYHFITEEEFKASVKKGELLEWNVVYGNKYGTLKRSVSEVLEKGESIILDTDTVGAFNIRKQFPKAVLIFIVPHSPEVLYGRLKKRNTESPERIKKRLETVSTEVARMPEYDYIVVNEFIDTAVLQVSSIIEAEKLRTSKILPTLSEWRKYINE